MDKLKIEVENCYWIKKLYHKFDFSSYKTFVIYAPNGVMKTSFAKTLKDITVWKSPCDQTDDTLIPIYNFFVDDDENKIQPEEICVIEPYNAKALESEKNILTLLADEGTRKEYLEIFEEIESFKKTTLSSLKKISNSSNYEEEILEAFSHLKKKNIFELFEAILSDIKKSSNVFKFKYNSVFDKGGKVKQFLSEHFALFKQYIEKYNDLINKSDFFAKDSGRVFGTTEAKDLNGSLEGEEYFLAGHKLVLKSHGDVSTKKRLSEIIEEEVTKIFNDAWLKEIFDKIDKLLDNNKELKTFKKVIEDDNSILLKLHDYESFRIEVWFAFLHEIKTGIESLVQLYNSKKADLERIIQKAKNNQSQWEEAIEEFKNRFVNNPFSLEIKNKADAILNEETPAITFKFHGQELERNKLIENILSQGEKRAFYILNVIFEIKSRQLRNQKTLFIIDDIADSFDYKNKYAIVEYLNDLTKEDNFYSIILTHNFDFFRTITGRLNLPRENKLHALKTPNEIKIITELYQNLPFITWKNCMKAGQYHHKNYTSDDAKKHIIALIPFVRNLIEYAGSTESSTSHGDDFTTLTSLLHVKPNTNAIKFEDLKLIYRKHINKDDFDISINNTDLVYDELFNLAASINDQDYNLENKIILAIAIRHKAEEYMRSKVTNQDVISWNQTRILFDRYKNEFEHDSNHTEILKILESVNIMTPENIHLNSFMYEPILDMGIDELKSLYEKVCSLFS